MRGENVCRVWRGGARDWILCGEYVLRGRKEGDGAELRLWSCEIERRWTSIEGFGKRWSLDTERYSPALKRRQETGDREEAGEPARSAHLYSV